MVRRTGEAYLAQIHLQPTAVLRSQASTASPEPLSSSCPTWPDKGGEDKHPRLYPDLVSGPPASG